MKRSTWIAVLPFVAGVIATILVMRPDDPAQRPPTASAESPGIVVDPGGTGTGANGPDAAHPVETKKATAPRRSDKERLANVHALFAANSNGSESDAWADVPDLRYYLDPQVIASMGGLSQGELLRKINDERSPEAAYALAMRYHAEEESHVLLLLVAAGFAQKPGPLLDAMNGCCAYPPGDEVARRAATIRLEALRLLARELNLPESANWPKIPLDPDIGEEVQAQRAAYVDELNQSSMDANGERWVK